MADTALGSEDITEATTSNQEDSSKTIEGEATEITEASDKKDDDGDKKGPPTSKEDDEAHDKKLSDEDDKSTEDDKKSDDDDEDEADGFDDFTLPDDVVINEELMASFTELATELELSQEQAQKLIDLQLQASEKAISAQAEQWATIRSDWVDAAKADKEIGGVDFEKKIGVAGRAVSKFGTPELVEALNLHGVGDHPEFIRFMYRVGKTLKEDTNTPGKPSNPAKDAAETLYPNQGQKKE